MKLFRSLKPSSSVCRLSLSSSLCLGYLALGCLAAPVGETILYSPCDPFRLYSSGAATDEEVQSMKQAVTLWQSAGLMTSAVDAGSDHPSEIPVQFRAAPEAFHGIYEGSRGEIVINRALSGTERDVTVAHELGHAMGMPHVDVTSRLSVMNPANLERPPDAQDFAQLRALWGECPSALP